MSQVEEYDVLVIGAGPGGYVCAIRCAQLGLKTACVEGRKTLGGTCLNIGCIPSKALLESSHHFDQIKNHIEEHGIHVESVRLELDKMIERKNQVVKGITQGVEFLFNKNKVKWLKGWASLKSSNEISIKNQDQETLVRAKKIVIASGSEPIELRFAPFDHQIIVDSTDALNFTKVPEHLVVIGGGVIGLELGSVWKRLGAKVTVVEALDKILGPTDGAVSQAMQRVLKKQGIEFLLKAKVEKIEKKGSTATVTGTVDGKDSFSINCDKVLVAVGRRPLTKDIGLEKIGVNLDQRGFVKVDSHFATSVPGIYAIGDATPGPMLAHKAEEEGVCLAELFAGQKGHVSYNSIPSVVYTSPEIASVGLSEEECVAQNIPFKTGKFLFKANGRAKAMGEDEGFVKVIAHKETDKLLGVHILGAMASEVISEAVMAFEYGASSEDIARSVHAHPTLSEALKEAALDVEKRAIHS